MIRTFLAPLAVSVLATGASAAPPLDVAASKGAIDATLATIYPELGALYRDIHSHPELGFQETRTAALLAARMRKIGFTVTEHVAKTGIVAIFKNGPGPVVLVRTELDALPLEEKTGLSYASRAQQTTEDGRLSFVDHACGHDSHMAWWVGTAQTLVAMKDRWHGTLMFVGQPAEELGRGAKAMVADGIYTRFPRPDYGFAAHVEPSATGTVRIKQGVVTSAADSVTITFHGAGTHGSAPNKGIDPIVEGAHFVDDVQTVISREKDPMEFGVVTVGAFQAGTVGNIIPDHADLQLTIRSYDPGVRKILNDGVAATANAVAAMARAPAPTIQHTDAVPPVVNDDALAAEEADILRAALGNGNVELVPAYKPGITASEDYSEFVIAGVPHSVLFNIGGVDRATIARYKTEGKVQPTNHSPYFAPDPEPTIRTGVETLALAVLSVTGGAR